MPVALQGVVGLRCTSLSLYGVVGCMKLTRSTLCLHCNFFHRATDLLLTGKRIVTSYEVLAQEYFREVDERVGLTGDDATRIEYVSGSVEAACALGLADGIGTIFSPSLFFTHITRRDKKLISNV